MDKVISIEVVRGPKGLKQILGDLFVLENEAVLFKCDTLELPDLNNDGKEGNEQGQSCIPEGTYVCIKREATKAIPYKHILITGIPGRGGVCIHKANFVSQIKGCIAVGMKEVDLNGDGIADVSQSGVAFDKIMELTPNEFKLTIK